MSTDKSPFAPKAALSGQPLKKVRKAAVFINFLLMIALCGIWAYYSRTFIRHMSSYNVNLNSGGADFGTGPGSGNSGDGPGAGESGSGKGKFKDAKGFSGIGKTFLEQYKDKINPHILAQVKKIKRNPMEVKQITAPVHMDMLFNEFIFTGKFAPVKMLTGELVKRPSMSIDEYKQLVKNNQKPTREQLLLVRNTVFKTIAVMGINNIVSKHVLLQYYLETILRRKLDTDEQSAKIIAALLKNAKSTQGNKK